MKLVKGGAVASQDFVVLDLTLGVSLRLGAAVEPDPSVGLFNAQGVAERLGSGPGALPEVGQLCGTYAGFALSDGAVVSARPAPAALDDPLQMGSPELESAE